ncbi:MAG: C1 family peptidase [Clostridia bacterium]|nr:C1 family peptidase [Clostridia bacterium]
MTKQKFISSCLCLVFALISVLFFYISPQSVYAEDKSNLSRYNLTTDKQIARKDQGGYSLCWAFSASRSLETYLQNFNINIDISESFASLAYANYVRNPEIDISHEQNNNASYIVGNSGHSLYFQRGLNTYGIATEEDVPYSLVPTFRNASPDEYNTHLSTYLPYANTTLVSDLNFVWAGDIDKQNDAISNIKKYLINYGSVYTQVNMLYMYDNQNTKCILTPEIEPPRTNHAVSIVGWDDNYTYAEKLGAFLVMNSYGEYDEFFYVMYDDYNVTAFAKCIESLKINGKLYTTSLETNVHQGGFNTVLIAIAGVSGCLIVGVNFYVNKKHFGRRD